MSRRVPSRRAVRLGALGVVLLLVAAAVAAAGTGVVLVRRPLPSYDGEVSIEGLSAGVTVKRDDLGIPQIYADTPEDLFRAQGYVTAQDRFFEMDWRRHLASGRLSELVGEDEDALASDKVVRTLGWRDVAEQEVEQADDSTQAYLQAYADGVNAYLSGRSASEISVNYSVLGLGDQLPAIEEWTPVDSVVWFKAMAWDLAASSGDDDLDRARIYGVVQSVDRVEELYPDYPEDNGTVVTDAAAASAAAGTTSSEDAASGDDATTDSASAVAAAALAAGTTGDDATTDAATGADAATTATTDADVAEVLQALSEGAAEDALGTAAAAVAAVPETVGTGDGIGSNAWAVSGDLTLTGEPMLANDPHLATSLPGAWYQVGLHCTTLSDSCPYDVSGYTFSGVPGVVIGHNDRISWGMANLAADTTDYYLEQIDGDTYTSGGEQVALTTRTETIEVTGGEPVTITVRSTDHGPVVSDVLDEVADAGGSAPVTTPTAAASTEPDDAATGEDADTGGDGETSASSSASATASASAAPSTSSRRDAEPEDEYAVSLAWTALTPGHAMDAVFAVDRAEDFASFRTAAQRLDAPAQSFVYADVDGNIGYVASGRIPLRPGSATADPVPTDGSWPLPGWTDTYDWTGYVDTADLPVEENPSDGYVVAANQPVTDPVGGDVDFGDGYDYGYRASRIGDLIEQAYEQRGDLRIEDMESIQADNHNSIAPLLVPELLKIDLDGDYYTGAQDLLDGWDTMQEADSSAAAYFNAVWAALLDLTFADEMPEGTEPDGGSRWNEVVRELLERPKDTWWDDRRTAGVVETRDEILKQALMQARDSLTSTLGKRVEDWQWGRLHQLSLVETPLGASSSTTGLHWLLNEGPVDMSGGTSIVNAQSWDAAAGSFDVTSAPSMRMVVDLSDLDASRWVNGTGESGHPGSDHYTDQLQAWSENESYAWAYGEEAVSAATEHTMTLSPAG